MLAVSDTLSRVIVYDADVMERKYILKGHRGPVSAMSFILESNFLLTASLDSEISKWDILSGEKIATLKGHKNPIISMIVSDT